MSDEQPAKRGPGNPAWKTQGGGNPKGRPKKGSRLADAIKTIVDPYALARRVYELAMSRVGGDPQGADLMVEHTTSLQAANWLANNGYVKPTQQVEVSVTKAADEPLSAAERAEVMRLIKQEEEREEAKATEHTTPEEAGMIRAGLLELD